MWVSLLGAQPCPAALVDGPPHLPSPHLAVRRPVVQFVSRSWLAAYRCAAYRHVRLDVGAALRSASLRGLGELAAAAVVLAGLAARLPYAAVVELRGVPLQCGSVVTQQLRWQLGELLLAALAPSTRLRRLSADFLPHLPLLLEQRRAWGLRLEALAVAALPTAALLYQLPVLQRQPLTELGVFDAACLGEGDAAALATALATLPSLGSLRLGGSSSATTAAFAAAAASSSQPQGNSGGVCLPSLHLVAVAASLPGLQQLELSLTFGKHPSSVQQVCVDGTCHSVESS